MEKNVNNLKVAAQALVNYIDTENVFDKMADAGCGGVDPYRSDNFDAVIQAVKDALRDLGVETRPTGGFRPQTGGSCQIR